MIYKFLMDRPELELVNYFFSHDQWMKFLLWCDVFWKNAKSTF